MNHVRMMTLFMMTSLCVTHGIAADKQTVAAPNADLQAILDRGEDLLLKTGHSWPNHGNSYKKRTTAISL